MDFQRESARDCSQRNVVQTDIRSYRSLRAGEVRFYEVFMIRICERTDYPKLEEVVGIVKDKLWCGAGDMY